MDSLAKKLNIKTHEGWYAFSRDIIKEHGGWTLLARYNGTLINVLQAVYPEYQSDACGINKIKWSTCHVI